MGSSARNESASINQSAQQSTAENTSRFTKRNKMDLASGNFAKELPHTNTLGLSR
jgi:hypothetical protein